MERTIGFLRVRPAPGPPGGGRPAGHPPRPARTVPAGRRVARHLEGAVPAGEPDRPDAHPRGHLADGAAARGRPPRAGGRRRRGRDRVPDHHRPDRLSRRRGRRDVRRVDTGRADRHGTRAAGRGNRHTSAGGRQRAHDRVPARGHEAVGAGRAGQWRRRCASTHDPSLGGVRRLGRRGLDRKRARPGLAGRGGAPPRARARQPRLCRGGTGRDGQCRAGRQAVRRRADRVPRDQLLDPHPALGRPDAGQHRRLPRGPAPGPPHHTHRGCLAGAAPRRRVHPEPAGCDPGRPAPCDGGRGPHSHRGRRRPAAPGRGRGHADRREPG